MLQNGHHMEGVNFVKDVRIRLDSVSIIVGDRCMLGLSMEHIVTLVRADMEHVWGMLEAS